MSSSGSTVPNPGTLPLVATVAASMTDSGRPLCAWRLQAAAARMRILRCLPLLLASLLLAACGGGGSSPLAVQIAIAPTSATVPVGATLQFSATVFNTSTTGVTWTVSGTGDVGSISSSGVFTAPQTVPSPASVTVTATSQADKNAKATATLTIVAAGHGGFSNASLKGNYVFSFSALDTNSVSSFGAGVLTADGNGNLTTGLEDLNQGGIGFEPGIQFNGNYNINADGTGTATLGFASGTVQWKFVMLADGSARFIDFNSNLTGSGTLEPQDANALTATAFAGSYVFKLLGDSANGTVAQAGVLTVDSTGHIISGKEDINDQGTLNSESITGNYNLGANGRVTAQLTTTLGTNNFIFYIVNSNQLRLLETDFPFPATQGLALRQSGTFSNSTLNGGYVFSTTASGGNDFIQSAGQFNADGQGNLTSGAIDENDLGVATSALLGASTYAVASNGRATITLTPDSGLSPIHLAVYLADGTHGMAIGLDSSLVTSGEVFAQSGGPFSLASLQGGFGILLDGFNSNSTTGNTQPLELSVQLTIDNAGNATGREDVNNNGTLLSGQVVSGTFTMNSNGRGTFQLNENIGPSQFAVYMISKSRFLLVGLDNFQLLQGTGQIQ